MKVRADRRVGLLLAGALLLTFVAIGATVVLPSIDPSLDEEAAELSGDARRGHEIYQAEGLWHCSAAYVRETSVDGARTGTTATSSGDVADMNPVMLGIERAATDPFDAASIADACAVSLSDEEVAAVDAFLQTRRGE